MILIKVANASSYLDMGQAFKDVDEYINKEGYVVIDSRSRKPVIVDSAVMKTYLIGGVKPADVIRAVISRPQKSKYGRAFIVWSGILMDDEICNHEIIF